MRRTFSQSLTCLTLAFLFSIVPLAAQGGGELHFAMKTDPKTLNPALAEDQASEAIRYLTGGVLIRVSGVPARTRHQVAHR